MQKEESGKSNPKLLDTYERIFLSRKHRKSFIALWLIAACLFTSASAQDANKSKTRASDDPGARQLRGRWQGHH